MSIFLPTRNIIVPKWSMGFIGGGTIGAIASSRRRSGGGGAPVYKETFGTDSTDGPYLGNNGARKYLAIQFTPTSSYSITAFDVYIRKVGTPANLSATLRTVSGGLTTSTVLATSGTTITAGDVSTSSGFIQWLIPSTSLTSGTAYAVALAIATVDASNYYIFRVGGFGSGIVDSSADGTTWSLSSSRQGYSKSYN